MTRAFTGEQLAKALNLDLTTEELYKHLDNKKDKKYRVHSNGFWATVWRRIHPRKIFLIRFQSGQSVILMADSESDACIEAVPFLTEHFHRCENPSYNKSCSKCLSLYDKLADDLNRASITWLGWGQPDYNWVIHLN